MSQLARETNKTIMGKKEKFQKIFQFLASYLSFLMQYLEVLMFFYFENTDPCLSETRTRI